MVTELLLLRHGESEGNVAAALAREADAEEIAVPARDADVRLTELGRQQAMAAGAGLRRLGLPVRVVSSTYERAVETAALAVREAGLATAVEVDERLRDRELGVLDRLTVTGVAARFPQEAELRRWLGKYYHRPAGGESWADVKLRLRSWLTDLVSEDRTGSTLVVSHDVVITLLRAICEGLGEEDVLDLARRTPLRNASLSRLVRTERGWTVREYDDVDHLTRAGLQVTEHRGERHERP